MREPVVTGTKDAVLSNTCVFADELKLGASRRITVDDPPVVAVINDGRTCRVLGHTATGRETKG